MSQQVQAVQAVEKKRLLSSLHASRVAHAHNPSYCGTAGGSAAAHACRRMPHLVTDQGTRMYSCACRHTVHKPPAPRL